MYPYELFFGVGLYEICLTVGVLLAFILADRLAVRCGFSLRLQRFFIIVIPVTIAVGFLGATAFQSFYNFLKTGVFVWGGMTFYGGVIFGVIAFLGLWFGLGKLVLKSDEHIRRFGDVADIAACVVPLAHAIGRIGCFFAGCCHGQETDAWYGVEMLTKNGWVKVVPVQLLEAAFLLFLAAALFYLLFVLKIRKKDGNGSSRRVPLLAVYAAAYGVWRFFIEYARGDERGATFVSFLSPSQLTAILLIAVGAVYFCVRFFACSKQGATENTDKING